MTASPGRDGLEEESIMSTYVRTSPSGRRMNTGQKAHNAASRAGNSNMLAFVARFGFAANGLIHVLIGYLAIRIALHQGGESD